MGVALFGTLTGWSIAVTSGLVGLVGLLAAHAGRKEATPFGEAHAALALIAIWTAVQLLPLPASWVGVLAPESLEAPRTTALALGELPSVYGCLTRSATDTVRELLKAITICAAFFAGTSIVQLTGRRAVVLAGVAGALTAGVLTIVHEAADADRVYGVYEFPYPPSLIGPIGNQNHLAGFLAMAVPALLGLAMELERRAQRALAYGGAALVGATSLAAISRGGVLSLGVGLLGFMLLLAWHARRRADRAAMRRALYGVMAVLVTLVALMLAAYGLGERLANDFRASSTGKLMLAADSLVLLSDAPIAGVGRGAFRIAYVTLGGDSDRMFFPENLLVQWSTEWGLPATLLLLGSLGSAWIRAARKAESATQIGALAGVLSIFVHDQVDFALENLAIAISTATLFAAAVAPSHHRSTEPRSPTPREKLIGTVPAVAVALSVLAFGWYVHASDARRLERELLALTADGNWTEVDVLARSAMRMHPSEPVFPLILGWAAASRDARDAPRWLNRAMALAPDWPSPHLVTARWLARRGRLSQAWLEVREAERARPEAAANEVCLFATLSDDPTPLIRVFQAEPSRERVLSRAASCPGVPDGVAEALDRELLDGGDGGVETDARVRLAGRALSDGDANAALSLLEGADDASWSVRFVRASAFVTLHRPTDAIALLQGSAPASLEPRRIEALARAYTAAGDAEGMRRSMEMLRAFAAGSGPRLAANALLLGRLEQMLGNSGRAYQAFDDAHRLDPSSGGLAATANLAEREGDLRRAHLARTELCRSHSPTSAECEAARALDMRLRAAE